MDPVTQVVRIDESLLADGYVTIEDDGKLWVPTIDGDVMALGRVIGLMEERKQIDDDYDPDTGTMEGRAEPYAVRRLVSEWEVIDE